MIENITNIEEFGFWVASYRASILANPNTTQSNEPKGLFELDNLPGQPPYLFLLNCPWDTIPESVKQRIVLQYESAKESPGNEHLYISPSGIQIKATSPLLKESPAGTVDIIGEFVVPTAGLRLEIAASQKGWLIVKRELGEDKSVEKWAKYFMDGNNLDKPLRRTRILGAKVQQLQNLARFMENSRNKAVIYTP